MKCSFLALALLFIAYGVIAQQKPTGAVRTAYADKKGVIRWTDDDKELALFGANYCLPSACDYRAGGYVTNDRKKMVDQDMAHFARMGFDALRSSFWGDFENTDRAGNLVNNDHLDLLDYVISKAKERGIYILLSPIVTYSSQWPDAMGDTMSTKGSLSMTFKKSELGTNPKAIAAECNYITQLLNHINPYTGLAIKDDPAVVFVEMINEPWHHADDLEGSIKYINALVDAVRNTGCKKVVFHNVSQDFNIAKAMEKSKIQGATFAWYPTGLNSGHTLKGNYLPVVDEYSSEMLRPELSKLARIVYEFDSPDYLTGYMYPAMARSFRRMGAQWASMFSYDMLATAPYNLGWQTHYLNMVYTPTKAISAIIAGEVMRNIPMYKDYGKYPSNTSFGPFRISYQDNLGEMNAPEKFYYTNTTTSTPVAIDHLDKIVGYGSSPVVNYEGKGIYFLDKISKNTWRLEVYPDAVQVDDPFKMPSPGKVVTRTIHHIWPMQVKLPGLGNSFDVIPLNENNTYFTKATDSKIDIQPGVYILTADKGFDKAALPSSIGYVKMNEFVCLNDQQLPLQLVAGSQLEFVAGKPLIITADVYNAKAPQSVTLFLKTANARRFWPIQMDRTKGYTYQATVPWNAKTLSAGALEYCIVVKDNNDITNYPSGIHISPSDWDYYGSETWKGRILPANGPVKLLQPEKDADKMAFTRIGDDVRFGIFKMIPASDSGDDAFHLELPLSYDRDLTDYTVSVSIIDQLTDCSAILDSARSLILNARGISQKQDAYITLVENDGTSWSTKIPVKASWEKVVIPLNDLQVSKGAMLPLGYPGRWAYWFTPAAGRGQSGDHVHIKNVEWVQISMRQSSATPLEANAASYIDLSGVDLGFSNRQ